MSALTRVLRAAYAALGPEVPNQLFFQYSTRLNKEATVNGLVRHAQVLILGILDLWPSGNLFRRPVQHQFTDDGLTQRLMDGQKAQLGPPRRLPRRISVARPVLRTATMPCHLPAYGRGSPPQACSNLTHRRTRSNPA